MQPRLVQRIEQPLILEQRIWASTGKSGRCRWGSMEQFPSKDRSTGAIRRGLCSPESAHEDPRQEARNNQLFSQSLGGWQCALSEGLAVQVFFKVLMGCRPNMPESMPEGFRKLMMDCWDTDATKRPPFEEVHRRLQVSLLSHSLPHAQRRQLLQTLYAFCSAQS